MHISIESPAQAEIEALIQALAVACRAVLMKGQTGELKRMYTLPAQRGKGVARALLSFLEEAATCRGCTEFVLETGNRQPEAVALYHRCGYRVCGPFGNCTEDPNSIFMRKNTALKKPEEPDECSRHTEAVPFASPQRY